MLSREKKSCSHFQTKRRVTSLYPGQSLPCPKYSNPTAAPNAPISHYCDDYNAACQEKIQQRQLVLAGPPQQDQKEDEPRQKTVLPLKPKERQQEVIQLLQLIKEDANSCKTQPATVTSSSSTDSRLKPGRKHPAHSCTHHSRFCKWNSFSVDDDKTTSTLTSVQICEKTPERKVRFSSPTVLVRRQRINGCRSPPAPHPLERRQVNESESRQDDLGSAARSEDNESRQEQATVATSTTTIPTLAGGSCNHRTSTVKRGSCHHMPDTDDAAKVSILSSRSRKTRVHRVSSSLPISGAPVLIPNCHERMYNRSRMKQADGKERRAAIAQKNVEKRRIRQPQDFGKISESRAGDMYDRGMTYLREKELRLRNKGRDPGRQDASSSPLLIASDRRSVYRRKYDRSRTQEADGKERRKVVAKKNLNKDIHRIPCPEDFGKLSRSRAGDMYDRGMTFLQARQTRLRKKKIEHQNHASAPSHHASITIPEAAFAKTSSKKSGSCHTGLSYLSPFISCNPSPYPPFKGHMDIEKCRQYSWGSLETTLQCSSLSFDSVWNEEAPSSENTCSRDQRDSSLCVNVLFTSKSSNGQNSLNHTLIHDSKSGDSRSTESKNMRVLVTKLANCYRTVPSAQNYVKPNSMEDESTSTRTQSQGSKSGDCSSDEPIQDMIVFERTDTNDSTPMELKSNVNVFDRLLGALVDADWLHLDMQKFCFCIN